MTYIFVSLHNSHCVNALTLRNHADKKKQISASDKQPQKQK
jgi:hypothetical protein